MSMKAIHERNEQEADVAQRWWRLPPNTLLPLEDGQHCLLIYQGEPGGAMGPDVRDAVLRFLPKVAVSDPLDEKERGIGGDVEFHTRASDWLAHGHHTDPRYNRVILHVVLMLDNTIPTRRQDGLAIPTASLLDRLLLPDLFSGWPCQQKPPSALTLTLLAAGLLRFLGRRLAFRQKLLEGRATATSHTELDAYSLCLLPALAEGLGYGRDRAFFVAVGQRMVGQSEHLPEPLGHTPQPPRIDAQRLRILSQLNARWRPEGIWPTLLQVVQQAEDVKSAILALRAAFLPLSQARTDILICNIVLPFAAAVAELENDAPLATKAQQIYLSYPGLVSNRITRMMSTQLQLPAEPGQACLQQGLHHIYAQTCQVKNCRACLCGGEPL